VQAWWKGHPRCVVHGTPVHGSWLKHVEHWCSLLQRQRRRIVAFASTADLEAKRLPCIAAWNAVAQPCNGTTKSAANGMAEAVPAAA